MPADEEIITQSSTEKAQRTTELFLCVLCAFSVFSVKPFLSFWVATSLRTLQ
jgi:hypothetical protein